MSNRIKGGLVSAFLLLVGVSLAGFGGMKTHLLQRLRREGVVAEGTVLEHTQGQYSRRSSHYSLTVEFTPVQGRPLRKTLDVDGWTYRSAVETGRVPVRYLASDPQNCSFGDPALLPYQVVGMLGGAMFLLSPLCWWLTRREALLQATVLDAPGKQAEHASRVESRVATR